MAINLKRKRGAVSYKEPSSEDDFSEDSDQSRPSSSKQNAQRRRSTRRRLTPREESPIRDSQHSPPLETTGNGIRSGKLALRARRRLTYRESSSDEYDEEDDFEAAAATPQRQKPQSDRATTAGKKARTRGTPRRRAIGAPLKRARTPPPADLPRAIVSDGAIPNWAALPYHVLLQIFVYASHPLHDENFTPTTSIPWLARVARICSPFTKPALTALYRNPPIFAIRQNRKDLVHHLISPPAEAHEDYAVMVKRLELDATKMSKLTDVTNSVADLVALLSSLKTLKEIDILDPFDKPPYRPRARRIRRWLYPDELFEALRQGELRLKSWRWNNSYCAHGLLWVKSIHETNAFQSLRELTITKYDSLPVPKIGEDEQPAPTAEELLGSALAVLPNLISLVFETCGVVNERLLPLLPANLRSLSIINCRDIFANPLQAFLASHGTQLKELILNHNQCLDLSFIVTLKASCPLLEILRMDTHYYNSLSTTTDNEPLYDELLQDGELPTWPSTLQVIDMEFLRKWSPDAAIMFFTSLIDSANELPWLREIVITAMVDVDWRQRAEFRKKWTARFHKVFATNAMPPTPHLQSFKAFREWVNNSPGSGEVRGSLPSDVSGKAEATVEQKPEDEASDSDLPLVPGSKQKRDDKWDKQRLRSRARTSTTYEEMSNDESADDEESDDDEVKYTQGLCHTVLFRIDNSRPQEQIYDEADFLDDEASGDEDWDGANAGEEDTYAW